MRLYSYVCHGFRALHATVFCLLNVSYLRSTNHSSGLPYEPSANQILPPLIFPALGRILRSRRSHLSPLPFYRGACVHDPLGAPAAYSHFSLDLSTSALNRALSASSSFTRFLNTSSWATSDLMVGDFLELRSRWRRCSARCTARRRVTACLSVRAQPHLVQGSVIRFGNRSICCDDGEEAIRQGTSVVVDPLDLGIPARFSLCALFAGRKLVDGEASDDGIFLITQEVGSCPRMHIGAQRLTLSTTKATEDLRVHLDGPPLPPLGFNALYAPSTRGCLLAGSKIFQPQNFCTFRGWIYVLASQSGMLQSTPCTFIPLEDRVAISVSASLSCSSELYRVNSLRNDTTGDDSVADQ